MNTDIFKELNEYQIREFNRKGEAVKLLARLAADLAPILTELYDEPGYIEIPKFDKEKGKYSTKGSDLVFVYQSEHNIPYFDNGGDELVDIKGSLFWVYVKQITDWIFNVLLDTLKKNESSREKRLQQLFKSVDVVKEFKHD